MTAVAFTVPADAQAARTWQPPVDVSVEQSDPGSGVEVAVDAQGNAIAVWTKGVEGVQAATRPAGGSWSAPESISAPGQSGLYPGVAVDALGNAVAVWSRSDGSHSMIQAASRSAGGSWGAPQDLSLPGRDNYFATVAVDEQGNAVVAWSRRAVGANLLQVAIRPAGGAWGPAQSLTSAGSASPGGIAIRQGRAAVGFSYDPGGGTKNAVSVATATVGGDWSVREVTSSVPVSGATAPPALSPPGVAVDAQGNVVAIWMRSFGTNEQSVIQTASGAVGSSEWSAPQDLSGREVSASGPVVEFDANGNATAAWTRTTTVALATFNSHVESASRPAGGSWSSPQNLSPAQENAVLTGMAVSPNGGAVAVWRRFEGSHGGGITPDPAVGESFTPVAAIRSAAGVWSAGRDIAPAGPYELTPTVGIDADGDAVALWSRSSTAGRTGGRAVQAAAYEETNPAPTPTSTSTSTPAPTPTPTPTTGGGASDGGSGTSGGGSGSGSPVLGSVSTPGSGAPQAGGDHVLPMTGAEAARARGLRRCLASVRHLQRRQPARARRGVRGKRRTRAARRRCLARFGRTPGRVRGLRARALSATEGVLSFQAPGSDGSRAPAASSYVVKQSLAPIRGQRGFERSRSLCGGACRFSVARVGAEITLTITDLRPNTTHYYAVAARDNVSRRRGPRSQTIKVTTR